MALDSPLTLPWLLVATPQLLDGNFKQSVVLMVEHSETGSMGFILNRPIRAALADLVTVPNVEIPSHIPVWNGGPVDKGTGVILQDHTQLKSRGDDQPVRLALSSSESALIDLVDYAKQHEAVAGAAAEVEKGDAARYPYRFLVGYAGWGPGQLMDEIKQGAWLQTKATWRLVFESNWKTMWDEALGTVGVTPRALVTAAHQYLN